MKAFASESHYRVLWLLACAVLAGACTEGGQTVTDATVQRDSPEIFTVNYPLAYFAERIAADSARIVFPAPAGIDPATWSPAPDVVAAYQQADLILLNGAGYAGWVQLASVPQSRLVDTSAAYQEDLIPLEGEVTHSHGPGGQHSHDATAFTTWLDMDLAIAQARAVFDALLTLQPDNETVYRQRLLALEEDLGALDKRLRAVSTRIDGAPLLFSHPVYQYLERRYELNGYSVHWEPDEVPAETEWRRLTGLLSSHPAAWMFWEGEPALNSVRRLEQIGVRSLVFRPAGNKPEEGDLLSVMKENLRALENEFAAAN